MKKQTPQWRLLRALLLLAILLIAHRQALASPVFQAVNQTSPPPSATSQQPTPAPTQEPDARPLALPQGGTPWWLTVLGIVVTATITGVGWWVTSKEQRRLAKLQERMLRERNLALSSVEKMRALGEYIEFPNRMSTNRDRRDIRQRYDQEWESLFGIYRTYAFRYDELAFGDDSIDTDPEHLGNLLNQIDMCVDSWVHSLKEGVGFEQAGDHLIKAMELVEVAVKRLDEIERRLLLNDIPVTDEPVKLNS